MLHPNLDPFSSSLDKRQHGDVVTLFTMITAEVNLMPIRGPQGECERGLEKLNVSERERERCVGGKSDSEKKRMCVCEREY